MIDGKEGAAMSGKTSTSVKRKYNEKAYDRLAITVPKGQKAVIEAAALAAGESVNLYTQKALLQRMGLDAWHETEESQSE